MLRPWQGQFAPLLFFIQFALAGFAFHAHEARVWQWTIALAAGLNLLGWLWAQRIARAIRDTPTSRVASAAQGYVELHGRGQPHEGVPLLTPHSQLPCLWYRYRLFRREDNKWEQVERAESRTPFDLVDDSGRCTLEPEGAHIQSTRKETRTHGDYRHEEEVLLKDDVLYAIGAFRSRDGNDLELNARLEEGDLLAEWKADPEELHRRFDLDGDGEISPKEWTLARQAARREIARQHQALRAQPKRHYLSRPEDGRPFLISNLPPDALGKRYAWLARLFMALMLASLVGLAFMLKRGG
ncbi:MAG: hypothetical protein AB1421_10240 [Pseudomonadota bacterium]